MEAFRIALEEIVILRKKYMICTLLSITAGVLLTLSVALYKGIRIGSENYNATVVNGVDGVALIRLLDMQGDYEEFIRRASEIEGVNAIGTMDVQGSTVLSEMDELLDIQSGKASRRLNVQDHVLEMRLINPTLLPWCEIKLRHGEAWEKLSHTENKHYYLYLGSDYEHIPVGTQYCLKDGSVFEVAGILEKGFRYVKNITPEAISSVITMDYTLNCDREIFCITDFALGNEIYVNIKEGYDISIVLEKVRGLAKDMGMDSVFCTMREIFDEGYQLSDRLIHYMIQLIGVVLFCCVILNLCFRIIMIWEQRKNYGILVSQGFSKACMLNVSFIREAIIFVLSFSGIMMVGFGIVKEWYVWDDSFFLFQKLFCGYVIPIILGYLLILSCVCLVVFAIWLKRKTPVQMIRN